MDFFYFIIGLFILIITILLIVAFFRMASRVGALLKEAQAIRKILDIQLNLQTTTLPTGETRRQP